MKKRIRKTRDRLQKTIRNEANPHKAFEHAAYGELRSPIEKLVCRYRTSQEAVSRCISAGQSEDNLELQTWTHFAEKDRSDLARFTLETLDNADAQKWKALFAARHSAITAPPFNHISPEPKRAHILFLKTALDATGAQMTLAELAARLEAKTGADLQQANIAAVMKRPAPDDGYSWLRKLAKELKFPLAKGRRGPRK